MGLGRPVTLITGATGFLGSALVRRLARQGHTVRAVVRGATHDERTARLRAALGGPDGVQGRQVEAVPGDLAQPYLGLSAEEFAALGQDVGRIIHCGARVNMTLPYGSLYEANVRATRELLELAESGGARFGYVSSLAAVARSVTGEPFELIDPVSGGYGQTKWSADRLVCVAHQEGRVDAVILRPGRVTADSRTARGNPDDLLERVIRICARLGAAPVLDTRVRLSPVDWVGDLIEALSGAPESAGRAYHLVSAETVAWADVVAALRGAGHALAEVPYVRWRSMVVAAGREDPLLARVALALPADRLAFDDRPGFRPLNAARTLAGRCPQAPPARVLLRDTIAAWQKAGELPGPS